MKSKPKKRRNRKDANALKKPFFQKGKEGMAEDHQANAFFQKAGVQPKLELGKADSPQEKEADQVAKQVVDAGVERKEDITRQSEEEEEMMQTKRQLHRMEEEEPQAKRELHRQEEEEPQAKREIKRQESEEEEMQAKPDPLLRSAQQKDQAESNAATPSFEEQLSRTKGKGFPIPDDVLAEMEHKFGADFSAVRLHTDAEAVAMNQAIAAQAFTHGNDIYFNEGKYAPQTDEGKALLAHELTHIVQQKGE
jgi:hypothetical protein